MNNRGKWARYRTVTMILVETRTSPICQQQYSNASGNASISKKERAQAKSHFASAFQSAASKVVTPGTMERPLLWVNGPFAILYTVYAGTYVSLPPANNNPIAPLLKLASTQANDQTAYLNTLEHIQSVAVQNHYQLFLYDLGYNYAFNSKIVKGYAYLVGSDPTESPDYYNITPA